MINRRLFLAGLTATAAVASTMSLAGCGGTSNGQPISGGTLRFGYETEPTTLNPHLSSQDTVTPLLRNAFDSYLYRDAQGTYHPWLAESYQLSEDGLTLTLVLKEGVTFSDGQALSADAVVKNFEKFTEKSYTATNRVGRANLASWKATDARTVVFTLTQPDNLFLAYLASVSATPLSPASLSAENLKSGGPGIAGVGPFTITDYQQGASLTFSKREDYAWAPEALTGRQGPAHLDAVQVSFLPEASTRVGSLQSGQLDIIYGVPAQNVASLNGTGGFSYQEVLNSGTPYSLYLNVSKSPLDDVRVRRAFQQAVDLSTLVEKVYYSTAKRAWSSISPVSSFYDPSLEGGAITFDTKAANTLLDEAGWVKSSDGIRAKDGQQLSLRLVTYAMRPDLSIIMQIMVSQLKELGIAATTSVVDDIQGAVKEGNYDLALWAQHTAPTGNPSFFLNQFFRSGAASNLNGYSSPTTDEMLDRLAALPAGADDLGHGAQGDKGLAAADVALQEDLHGHGRLQGAGEVLPHARLPGGELVGQGGVQVGAQGVGAGGGPGRGGASGPVVGAALGQGGLEDERLLVAQPPLCDPPLLVVLRLVDPPVGGEGVDEMVVPAHGLGQRVGDVGGVELVQDGSHGLGHLPGRQGLGARVDGQGAGQERLALGLAEVVEDLEARARQLQAPPVPLDLSAHQRRGPR